MSVYINNNQPDASAKVKPGISFIWRSRSLAKKSLLGLHSKFGRTFFLMVQFIINPEKMPQKLTIDLVAEDIYRDILESINLQLRRKSLSLNI